MAESIAKQVQELKKHEPLLWGVIIVSAIIIIWLLLRKRKAQVIPPANNNYLVTNLPTYQIPGNNYTVNRPDNGYLPDVYNLSGPTIPTMTPGPPCGCGCSDCNSPTTYTFPSFDNLFGNLESALEAQYSGLLNGYLGTLDYRQRVFVTNETPVQYPFA